MGRKKKLKRLKKRKNEYNESNCGTKGAREVILGNEALDQVEIGEEKVERRKG